MTGLSLQSPHQQQGKEERKPPLTPTDGCEGAAVILSIFTLLNKKLAAGAELIQNQAAGASWLK